MDDDDSEIKYIPRTASIDLTRHTGFTIQDPIVVDDDDEEKPQPRWRPMSHPSSSPKSRSNSRTAEAGPSSSIRKDIGTEVTSRKRKRNTPNISPSKKPKPEVIILSEDDERFSSDNDEDDITYEQFYGIRNTSGLDINVQKKDDAKEIEEIIRSDYKLPHIPKSTTLRDFRPPDPSFEEIFSWDELVEGKAEAASTFRTHSTSRPKLRLVDQFKNSAGSVCKIIQQNDLTAIASVTPGDELEDDHVASAPKGGLVVHYNGRPVVFSGHQIRKTKPGNVSTIKHCTVNDLCFYPPNHEGITFLASTGYDDSVRFWPIRADGTQGVPRQYHCKEAPHVAILKPKSETLAVGESNLLIFPSHQQTPSVLKNPADTTRHRIGEVVWGCLGSDTQVFASNEPKDIDGDETSAHMAYDASNGRLLYKFDAQEAGESLAVHPYGGELALLTEAQCNGMLRIYDIARKNNKHIRQVSLQPFRGLERLSISSASYSPDGVYLALPRNDNCTHVYDTRMLERGILYDFVHGKKLKVNPGTGSFGIVAAQWITSRSGRRLRLVSGGADGCIRLFDPLVDSTHGEVIVETNADIGYFSIGDKDCGEHDLVVGDADGSVYIFDSQGQYWNF